jgi:DNA mismatch repair ATPase MutS
MPAFIRVATGLAQVPVEEIADERRLLRDGANAMAGLRRATWWLRFEPGQSNELAASIYEYVNLLFLIDVNAFVLATETLRQSRATTRAMFEAIGYVDVAQSVAAWRATLARWTRPELTEPRKALDVDRVVHPLVASAVPNSLDVEHASVLITGSNMSGKTTFVRALGVNAVLAQSLNTACARVWRSPLLRVRTSIGRADSVMEGKSYYLAEVESVLALIRAKESGDQHLFLLDEIFRGTNTTERIAAAYAVLAHLNRGLDLVVVATHDVEVLGLFGQEYTPYHFREQITDNVLSFDYLLQPGPSSTRNAIAVLEYMEYPESVVADALGALDWQERAEDRTRV